MSLRFPALSPDTHEKIASLIRTRAVTERARRFLQLALEAVDATPPAGLRAQWYGNAILISAKQERMAELLDCSVKTVQRAIAQPGPDGPAGEFSDFLHVETVVVRSDTGLPVQKLVYAVMIDRLEAMPTVDPTDEFEVFVLKFGPGLQDLRSSDVPETNVASDVASVVAPMSLPLSPACPVDVASLHDHEHEHDHDFKTHDHESMKHESFRNSVSNHSAEPVRMSSIKAEHVRAIVRNQEAALFARYFADAVAARWAKDCESDRVRMAALFHQVVRIGEAKDPGRVIGHQWKNRDSPDPRKRLKLAGEDEDFARKLLKPPSMNAIATTSQATVRPPIHSPLRAADGSVELSAAEYSRQQQMRAANLSALATMTRDN
jgi:hypothetical protein